MWKRILNFLKNLFKGKKKKERDVDIGVELPVDNTVCQVLECEILDIEELDDEPERLPDDGSAEIEENFII